MKLSDIKGKSDKDLAKTIKGLRKEIFELKLKKNTGQLEKISDIGMTKKNLAQALTILKERTLDNKAAK